MRTQRFPSPAHHFVGTGKAPFPQEQLVQKELEHMWPLVPWPTHGVGVSLSQKCPCLFAHLDVCAVQAGGSLAAADLLSTRPPLIQQLTPKLIFWGGKEEHGVRTQSQPSSPSAAPSRGRNAVFIPCLLFLMAVQILRVFRP